MLSRNSAFSIKPRLSLSLWSWLWKFARRCNRRDMMASGLAIQALLNSSRSLYDQWMSEEALDCEWQTRGLLFVFRSAEAMAHYAHVDQLLGSEFQMPARRFEGEAVQKLEPALLPGMAGGWLYESDAHLRPDKLMTSLHKALERLGVEIKQQCEVRGIDKQGRIARSVQTTHGAMAADAIVVAAGAWAPFLSKDLDCRIPIQPGKGYSITMPRPEICPEYPLIFEEQRVAITPMDSGYRIGSTMEFAGYDSTLNRKRLELLRHGAKLYLREPLREPVVEEWFGWRPMTTDSKPIIGPSPALSNVWIAAGHNMLGLSMAPGTGKLISELVCGMTPHIDPAPYCVERFQ
jgi:D-amino-acid dehydrogenase